jgi:hypothetical protein
MENTGSQFVGVDLFHYSAVGAWVSRHKVYVSSDFPDRAGVRSLVRVV